MHTLASTARAATPRTTAPVGHARRAAIRRSRVLSVVCALGLALLVLASASVGTVDVTLPEAARIVLGHLLPNMPWMHDGSLSPLQDQAVWQFRLPRTLLSILAGAGLALAGALMQVTVRNPLAEPYILGVSSGASVGAVSVIVLGSSAVANCPEEAPHDRGRLRPPRRVVRRPGGRLARPHRSGPAGPAGPDPRRCRGRHRHRGGQRAERLAPGGCFVLSLQPPLTPQAIPWTEFGTVQVGEHQLRTRGKADPVDPTHVAWTMQWDLVAADERLLESRTATHRWRVVGVDQLHEEVSQHDLELATGRLDEGFVVLRARRRGSPAGARSGGGR